MLGIRIDLGRSQASRPAAGNRWVCTPRGLVFTLLVALLWSGNPLLADPLVISEFMAANDRVLADMHEDFVDWVEVYNAADDVTSTEGWYLTDDTSDLRKWRFPALEIPPRGLLVVFASGKDRSDPERELHTNFRLSESGEFLALVEPDGSTIASQFRPRYPAQVGHASFGRALTVERVVLAAAGQQVRYLVPQDFTLGLTWTEVEFDDSQWQSAVIPLGYDRKEKPTYTDLLATDIEESMYRRNSTLYVRIQFDLQTLPAVGVSLALDLRYDDGVVIYLNGEEVARRGVAGNLNAFARASSERPDSLAQAGEIVGLSRASELLREGQNVLAIHGVNRAANNDDFFLGMDMEQLVATGLPNLSVGYFETPSPGWPDDSVLAQVAGAPEFSASSGGFYEPFYLDLAEASAGGAIYYTIDRTEPTESSTLYSEPILVDRNMEIRARAFVPGLVPSVVVRHRYARVDSELSDFSSNLPVVVFNHFLPAPKPDEYGGVEVVGPGHFFVFEPSGDSNRSHFTGGVNYAGDATFGVRGSSSRERPKKSYTFEIVDVVGDDQNAALLDMPADSDWILYGAYQYDLSLVRNAYIYEISNQVGRYAVRTRFCEVYMNFFGESVTERDYLGVYSLCERVRRGVERLPIDRMLPDEIEEPEVSGGYILRIDRPGGHDTIIDLGGGPAVVIDYPKSRVLALEQADWITNYFRGFVDSLSHPASIDPAVPMDEKPYAQYIDVLSWIDFHLLNEFTKNQDAFLYSTYFHKQRGEKLGCGPIWDFDRAMGSVGQSDGQDRGPGGWRLLGVLWWNSLFKDPVMWERYTNRWLELRQRELSTRNLLAILARMENELTEAAERNYDFWGYELLVEPSWQDEVAQLGQYVRDRVQWLDEQLVPPPELSHPAGDVDEGVVLTMSTPQSSVPSLTPHAKILYSINGEDPRLADEGRHPEARVYEGEFLPITENIRVKARTLDRGWSGLIDNIYIRSALPLVVTELMYHPASDTSGKFSASDFEFVELQNVGTEPVSISGVGIGFRPSAVVEHSHSGGQELATIEPGEYVVLVSNLEAFASRYDTAAIQVVGEFSDGTGTLSNFSQGLWLIGPIGEELMRFRYQSTWYPRTSGEGYSLVVTDVNAPLERWNEPAGWRRSLEIGGSPGRAEPLPQNLQRPSDITADGRVNVADVIGLIRHLFDGVSALPCDGDDANRRLLDANGDTKVNLSDVIWTLSYYFLGGASPVLGVQCVAIEDCPNSCDL